MLRIGVNAEDDDDEDKSWKYRDFVLDPQITNDWNRQPRTVWKDDYPGLDGLPRRTATEALVRAGHGGRGGDSGAGGQVIIHDNSAHAKSVSAWILSSGRPGKGGEPGVCAPVPGALSGPEDDEGGHGGVSHEKR